MATIRGKWRWNDGIENAPIPTRDITEEVLFISGKPYEDGLDTYGKVSIIRMSGALGALLLDISYTYVGSSNASSFLYNMLYSGEWLKRVNENLRIMDFGETDQEVSEEFYNFLVANATPVLTIAEQLTQIDENVQKIFDAGYAKGTAQGGYNEGYNDGKAEGYQNGYDEGNAEGIKEGIEQGKQAEWSALWDGIQLGGTRTDYASAFRYEYWNADTFRPKYDLVPTGCSMMFDRFNGQSKGDADAYEDTVDLSELLNKAGVILDTSNAKTFNNMFYISKINRVPYIDVTSATSQLTGIFANCYHLHTIDGFKVKESNIYNNIFATLPNLQNLTMYGTIGQNGFDTQWSTKLSRASIESIVSALSTETSGLTVTFSQEAVDKAFPPEESGASNADWAYIILFERHNWTFSLI